METLDAAAIPPIAWRIEDDGTLVIAPPAGSERGLFASEDETSSTSEYSGPYGIGSKSASRPRAEPGVVAQGERADLFKSFENLTTADLSGMDVSAVDDLSGLFWGCRKLVSVRFGAWDTARATSMWPCSGAAVRSPSWTSPAGTSRT